MIYMLVFTLGEVQQEMMKTAHSTTTNYAHTPTFSGEDYFCIFT